MGGARGTSPLAGTGRSPVLGKTNENTHNKPYAFRGFNAYDAYTSTD